MATVHITGKNDTAEEQTHHGSAVLHQVDANDAQKCSKTQLEVQRDESGGEKKTLGCKGGYNTRLWSV